ncbi:hypothetical protein AAW02_22580, partial [Aeromonas dhakensis]
MRDELPPLEPMANNVRQMFEEPVNNVAGRDVVFNQVVPERRFSNGERRQLGDLIRPLAAENQTSEKEEWRALHFPFGVNTIDEMDRSQFEAARQLLAAKLDAAKLRRQLYEQQEETERYKVAVRQEVNQKVATWEQERIKLLQQSNQLVRQKAELENALAERTRKIEELTTRQQRVQQAAPELPKKKSWPWKTLITWTMGATLAIVGTLVLQPAFERELRAEKNKSAMLTREDICLFNGQPFSWGTRIKTVTGMQKCVKSRTGQYLWQP